MKRRGLLSSGGEQTKPSSLERGIPPSLAGTKAHHNRAPRRTRLIIKEEEPKRNTRGDTDPKWENKEMHQRTNTTL
ncbi:hypothetical protein ROHU_008155 [Labeo rohita]|uniref:Uncharacterized protein n=1 Tax=Labeo rohita TaxID=84645 RepID=A0A498M7Z9_LABRO|nr:hypothetical protein ROHU_008155 [Labeo rohita]